MNHKQVKYILPAQKLDMGGFPIKQALPTQKVSQIDPFLLLHHGNVKYSDKRLARHQGIGPHPHRGFSPVTFVVQGEVHHRDSRGNNQIAKEGEVQWMHAGAGIIHSERPSEALAQRKGRQEIIQIWINSPAKSKMKIPEYFYVSSEELKNINHVDQGVEIKLVAGNYDDITGKVITESPLLLLWGNGKAGEKAIIEIPSRFNCALYVIKGGMHLTKYGRINAEELVYFEKEDESSKIELEIKEEGQFLVLAGEPIDEPISQSGPYVMNTETEILKAMRDYQMGKMGILIEE